jgi:hypothetical protein
VDYPNRAVGIHHIALWARSRKEVDAFHRRFLLKNAIPVSDPPAEYTVYAPGYSLLVGGRGTGKKHLVCAIGCAALRLTIQLSA